MSKAKRPFRLTRGGWVFILYTIGIGAGAINTGNNLLYLAFGIFLGLILASGVLSDLSLWKLEATLQLPKSIHAGQAGFIPIQVINHKKWFPSIAVRVELVGTLRGKPVTLQVFSPAIYSGEVFSGHFSWTPSQRGLFEIQSLRFSTKFPFG